MIRRTEISKLAFWHGVPEKTIQKDYVITRVLRELGPVMQDFALLFKGGTCLKKAHFPEYRFSEDLDFTLQEGSDAASALSALDAVAVVLSEQDLPVALGEPDQGKNGVTYLARTTGPLGSSDKLKIDVTTTELVVFPAVALTLIDAYSDAAVPVTLHCYSKEETALEKLVCLLDPARIQPRRFGPWTR